MERFDDDAVRRILERVRDTAGPDADDGGIDAEALVAAAAEVGYDPAVVRDAIALERLGETAEHRSVLDRCAGAGAVVVDARVPRSAEEALDVAEAWLSRAHRMTCRRLSPTTVVARRRSDVAASMGRSVTELFGDGRVGRLASVRVDVAPLSSGPAPDGAAGPTARSAVRLTADRTPSRRRRLTAGGLLGGTGIATAAVGIAESMFAWPVAAVSLTGIGAVTVASGRRHADRVEADLETFVAAIADGAMPVGTLRRVARAARRSVN